MTIGTAMTFEFKTATALEVSNAVRSGNVTARRVVESALELINSRNDELVAFTDITVERAFSKADHLDRKVANGETVGPLAGVPFSVKNLIDIEGLPTRAGSKINLDREPAYRDGSAIRSLEKAGAILLGAVNMGEYAYDFTGDNYHYGPSKNPHDPTRMAGGSSGGSGTSVSAGMVPFSIGSSSNGSIRVPSAFCGLFGLKPTYGRLSRAGAFPFVGSLDILGPLARSTADLAAIYDAMQGQDPDDPVMDPRAPEYVSNRLGSSISDLRIAVASGYFAQNGDNEVFEAVEHVASALGAQKRVELPEVQTARAAAYLITASEGASLHLERLQTRAADFDPAVRDRLIAANLMPSTWVDKAQKFRRWYRDEVSRIFQNVDIILAPATPCYAPKLGQKTFLLDGQEMLVRPNIGVFTQPISFIGLPVVVAPIWQSELPLGVQIIAPPWREDAALRVANYLEERGIAKAPVAN